MTADVQREDEARAQERAAETALVETAREGGACGTQAFGELVKTHQSWLVRLLVYLLGNRGDAEDVAQEAFVRAFLSLRNFRGDASFRGWLRVIATRLAFNHRRDQKTRRERTQEVGVLPYVLNGSGPVMDRDAIAKVLERISYPFREILILRHVEEMAVDDIASLLDIGQSAAKMRLSRARAQFWQVYEEMVKHDS